MTDELPLAAEFPASTHEDWLKLVRAALKDRAFERLTAKTYDGLAIEPLYPRCQERAADRGAARPLAGDGAGRSSRSGRRQRAGAARPGKRRDRLDAGVSRRDRRERLRARCLGGEHRQGARRRLPRCRHRHRAAHRGDHQGCRRPCRRAGEVARPCAGRGQHPLRPRSARRACGGWRRADPVERPRATLRRARRRTGGARFQRPAHGRRRTDRSQRRRLGGAGARLCAVRRGGLPARAGRRRRCARRGARA